ncbi:GLPGLI family protein [Aureivirga sp. CE67]|uniref:GLPGLI family protein n=1 Tax=Aureivirga sp. CE67 TaxID=1788983 RepID=UPI0018CBBB43|nr:GLPGLI family protein [Aureivirga sp. CE67]
MKNIQKLILATLFLIPSILLAQQFQGRAIYQTKTTFDLGQKNDTTKQGQVRAERRKAFENMLNQELEKRFVLDFNQKAAIYEEEAKVDVGASNPNAGRIKMMANVMSGGTVSNGVLYTDIQNRTYINKQELFGKNFLIKDKLPNYEWQLENETKKVGNYTCYKATAKTMMRDFQAEAKKMRDNFRKKQKAKIEPIIKEVQITVWYTPQIPISVGPEKFGGLPGLILEANIGNTQLVCTQITLNPKEKVEINPPKGGKEITQEKFDETRQKKMEEMSKNFRRGGGRGRGGFGGGRGR